MQTDDPGNIGSPKWDNHNGRLMVIVPLKVETFNHPTFGEKEATIADVHIIDGPHGPEVMYQTRVYPKVLQLQLASNVGTGRGNKGRLGKGVAKKGQSEPWVLEKLTDPEDIAAVDEYLSTLDDDEDDVF